MANRYSLNEIESIQNRKVFFDANVLIYLFWPSGQYNCENNYSKAFSQLLDFKNNKLYVNFLIISEVINRIHRIEYEKYLYNSNLNRQQFSYKKYRNNKEGKKTLSDIYLVVKDNILTTFSIVEKDFNKNDIESFLTLESLDFVDKAIQNICVNNNFVLCTNDRDFNNSKIDILSSNTAILNA